MKHPLSGQRVAVTGATGFVGRHLVDELKSHGASVVALVRPSPRAERLRVQGIECRSVSLDDPASIEQALHGCALVFHVAGAVDFGNDWEMLRRINVGGTINLLEAAYAAGIRRVVHTSSIVAIGASRKPRVLNEENRWNLGPLLSPYLTTKREAEEAALSRSRPGFEVVVVNPACVIGPNDIDQSEFGTLCKRHWKGRIPIYFGGGNNFVDVRDVAAGHVLAAVHGRPGERYFLGGENLTYRDFFQALSAVTGRTIPRFQLPSALAPLLAWAEQSLKKGKSKPNLAPAQARLMGWFFFADSRKAERELGYRARPVLASLADAFRYWFPARAA